MSAAKPKQKGRPLRSLGAIVGAIAPVLVPGAFVVAALAACSSPDTNARVDAIGPDRASFPAVAAALGRRCGTIDCHGSRYRNFRVYGYGGMRLDPNDRPDTPKAPTQAESDATYDGLVGLEPEIMREVVQAKGAGAERLTVVRKARGTEDHKGGSLIQPGEDGDTCLLSWLAGATNTAACKNVANAP